MLYRLSYAHQILFCFSVCFESSSDFLGLCVLRARQESNLRPAA